jgi:phosphopantothenoylcysteine decarboxylase / phosphopantothenate---cysteine ligase
MGTLEGKHILLGVTGSIACYKAADLASKLTQAGAIVDVILTRGALEFITPLTFQSVTGRPAFTDADLWGTTGHVTHIGLGHSAEILVIAPATANTLAKLAFGIADNLLSVTALAASCPLIIAPAMDGGMYSHPATQANLETLRSRGAVLVGPASGHLASGQAGVGRMVEPQEILGHIRLVLGQNGPLVGKKVIVTAGGTQEPIDPVRVISNTSSGKQGFAVAQAALDLGAKVILITGPVGLPTPTGASRVDVRTAAEMEKAVMEYVQTADVLIMAAAVADFRPHKTAAEKIKKEGGPSPIQLEKTTDILTSVAQYKRGSGRPVVSIGFAAESQDLLDNARTKLQAKELDFIVANDITAVDAGFGVDTNRVILLFAGGDVEPLPLMSKQAVAEVILQRIAQILITQ